MMSKAIEEGCRAVIVNSKRNGGAEVIVGERLGNIDPLYDGVMWAVDKPMKWESAFGDSGFDMYIPEIHLKRIDDYDGEEKSTWQELSHLWVPDELTEVAG